MMEASSYVLLVENGQNLKYTPGREPRDHLYLLNKARPWGGLALSLQTDEDDACDEARHLTCMGDGKTVYFGDADRQLTLFL